MLQSRRTLRVQVHSWCVLTHTHAVSALAETYVKTGATDGLRVAPAVVHFGGFELGRVHTQVVRLCNASSRALRVHVLPPDSAYFKVRRCCAPPGLQAVLQQDGQHGRTGRIYAWEAHLQHTEEAAPGCMRSRAATGTPVHGSST